MAQANAVFPMLAMGLRGGPVLLLSLAGGLVAAAISYHVFGRRLSTEEHVIDESLRHPVAESTKGVLAVIKKRIGCGASYATVARELNGRQIPSKTGGRWSPKVVRDIARRAA